ncbi:4Fe-4S dicluster domain-containing protein [Desulfobacula sp.]|uniref:4Fe-4S dicluster domain-containing protein n=1 Tax=Desulfobacula sp. TaxID=2593537 RepID=UPI002618E7F8|nr:4Fe-4S dicluster domain-containing protein [Desulfobacula sp.]
MSKSIFIDTSICTACRACQVACKQWHDLPAETTKNMGSFQNPPDLSFSTYKLVRMTEEMINGRLEWLFFPDQCRHCVDAPCLETAFDETAIYRDPATGAILYTRNTKQLDADEIIGSCPYNIPRKAADGTLGKCDMCNDRVRNGLKPACVTACPTGAMTFGDRDEILASANKRLEKVRQKFPKAMLLDPNEVNVIYLVAFDPKLYSEYAVASADRGGLSRGVALRKMMGPFAKLLKV